MENVEWQGEIIGQECPWGKVSSAGLLAVLYSRQEKGRETEKTDKRETEREAEETEEKKKKKMEVEEQCCFFNVLPPPYCTTWSIIWRLIYIFHNSYELLIL